VEEGVGGVHGKGMLGCVQGQGSAALSSPLANDACSGVCCGVHLSVIGSVYTYIFSCACMRPPSNWDIHSACHPFG
jgi:hypothetical protein